MDEEAVRGFLPPRAEGGGSAVPPPAPEAARPRPAATPPPAAGPPPTFVQPGGGSGETNTAAVAALVLGIAGIGMTVLFAGWLFFVALPCSILAWVFGVQGKRKVDRGEVSSQRGLAQAGHVLGIVGVVLGILAIIFWVVLFFGLGIDFQEFQDDLERELNQPASVPWRR